MHNTFTLFDADKLGHGPVTHGLSMKRVVDSVPMLERLAHILMSNMRRVPLTDMYLVHPVILSRRCPPNFRDAVRARITENFDEALELVNAAAYSVETLLLLGEGRSSNLIRRAVEWIKLQQLEDGGWHWKPKQVPSGGKRSEVWVTLTVYRLLKEVGEGDQLVVRRAGEFLSSSLYTEPPRSNSWARLSYIRAASLIIRDGSFEQRSEAKAYLRRSLAELTSSQLPNGGWAGSGKTPHGGLFQTAMVLYTLVEAGFGLAHDSVDKGLGFMLERGDRLLRARWGGVLVHALSAFTNTLLKLGLLD